MRILIKVFATAVSFFFLLKMVIKKKGETTINKHFKIIANGVLLRFSELISLPSHRPISTID